MPTETIKPKYDSEYNSKQATACIRFVVKVLGEVVKGNKDVDVESLPDFFESSNDILLYTLGWLEGQKASAKKAVDTRKENAVNNLVIGVRTLLKKTRAARSDVSWSLVEYASTHLELAEALDALADYKPPSEET